ncbi:MAG: hypothetical protein II543_07240, partial [Desulfovibrio sp.]|nr:hypothetical protein [Desulfovibrio sp.]
MLSSTFAGRFLPLALALLLGLAVLHVPAGAKASQQPTAAQRPGAVTARVNVAKPAGTKDAVPSAVYGQRGGGLPTTGIFVRKKRSLEQQVTAS